MTEQNKSPLWLCQGQSVRGISHQRNGLPNQDAIRWYPEYPHLATASQIILAVADGHGSAKSFRSDIGAKLAVETATRVINDFFLPEAYKDGLNLSTIKDLAHSVLPQRLVHEWKASVDKEFEEKPFTQEDWETLSSKEGEQAKQIVEDNPYLAYGATLLTVVVTESFILYLQLGDGDILCVDSQGRVSRPLERDPRLIGNETTSLCTDKAWRDFRVSLVSSKDCPPDTIPSLILLSTDGYANSYSSEEEFTKIGEDYRQMIKSEGMEFVASQLDNFLSETSQGGSGDDITLGLLKRLESNDRDYDNQRITALESQGEIMSKNQEDMSLQLEKLTSLQKKTSNAVFLFLGFLVPTTILTLVNFGISFFWFNGRIENLESQIEHKENAIKNLDTKLKALENKISSQYEQNNSQSQTNQTSR